MNKSHRITCDDSRVLSCLKETLPCITYNAKHKHMQLYGFSVVWCCFSEIAKYNSTWNRKLKQLKLESSDWTNAGPEPGCLQLIKKREREMYYFGKSMRFLICVENVGGMNRVCLPIKVIYKYHNHFDFLSNESHTIRCFCSWS